MTSPPSNSFSREFTQAIRREIDAAFQRGKLKLDRFKRILKEYSKRKEVKGLLSYLVQFEKVGARGMSFRKLHAIFLRVVQKAVYLTTPLSESLARRIVFEVIDEVLNDIVCARCHGTNIEVLFFPLNQRHTVYYCQDCHENVQVSNRIEYLPFLLQYFRELLEAKGAGPQRPDSRSTPELPAGTASEYAVRFLQVVYHMTANAHAFLEGADAPDLEAIITLWRFCRVNEFTAFLNTPQIQTQVTRGMVVALKQARFDIFRKGLAFLREHQAVPEAPAVELPARDFRQALLAKVFEFLSEGYISKVQRTLEFGAQEDILTETDLASHPDLEPAIYTGLSWCIKQGKVARFEEALDFALHVGVSVDVLSIPDRLQNITELVLECIQLQRVDRIFDKIRFGLKHHLFYQELAPHEQELVAQVKNNALYMANLADLFGQVSNSLVIFLFKTLPYNLYKMVLERKHLFEYQAKVEHIGTYIKKILNNYVMYGLNVKKIGTVAQFLKAYENARYQVRTANHAGREIGDFISFPLGKKQHLVSIRNVERIKPRLVHRTPAVYEFLNASMVLRAGLGPQGKGFTYSTPFGELIEICSDVEENQAYIVHFKQFLKRNFMAKLRDQLEDLDLAPDTTREIVEYFATHIEANQYVAVSAVTEVVDNLDTFFKQRVGPHEPAREAEIHALADTIRGIVSRILMPITMEDQFRCRMDLVAKGQIASEEVAKLTSLHEKSHYDILRERFFFQVLVENFINLYNAQDPTADFLLLG